MGIYAFRSGPSYRAATPDEQMGAALDMPLSLSSTLGQQFKGGILDSLGLGTAIREAALPEEAPTQQLFTTRGPTGELITLPDTPQMRRRATVQGFELQRETQQQLDVRRRDVGALSDEQFKSSPYYREGVKWDAGMTEDRAAALAEAYDAKRVREYFAEKRPITSFIGNLAGQAIDPINYIPIAGPAVKAANALRFGRVAGGAATSALDAAANTAIASGVTFEARKSMGDDITWQSTISDIAMSALIGGAFGSIGGLVESRRAGKLAVAEAAARDRLSTLRNVQDARVALNDAIDGIARGEDVSLGGNAADAVQRISRSLPEESSVRISRQALFDDRPTLTIDEYYSGAHEYQSNLAAAGSEIEKVTGATFKDPGIKALDTAAEKITRKGYKSAGDLTDVVRGGFETQSPEQADNVVAHLAERFDILDEGWAVTKQGYFDRKVLVRFENGTIGEIQLWNPKMLAAKKAEGHKLYTEWRSLPLDDPRAVDLQNRMERLYSAAMDEAEPEWRALAAGTSSVPNVGSNRSLQATSDMTLAVDQTSRKSTGDQSAPGSRTASAIRGASSENSSAGLRSQLTNSISGNSSGGISPLRQKNGPLSSVDLSTPKPEPLPTGKADADKRVGTADNFKAMSEQYRVNPDDGSFVEQADIDQLRREGRVTPEDEMELSEAQKTFDNGLAFGEALRAAAACVI